MTSFAPLASSSTQAELDLLWSPLRRPGRVEDKVLMRDTRHWLARLPRGVRPVELPRQFARIANELSQLWDSDEDRLVDYLEELLIDRRGGRRGFPALVQEEIRALHRHVLEYAGTRLAELDMPQAAALDTPSEAWTLA